MMDYTYAGRLLDPYHAGGFVDNWVDAEGVPIGGLARYPNGRLVGVSVYRWQGGTPRQFEEWRQQVLTPIIRRRGQQLVAEGKISEGYAKRMEQALLGELGTDPRAYSTMVPLPPDVERRAREHANEPARVPGDTRDE